MTNAAAAIIQFHHQILIECRDGFWQFPDAVPEPGESLPDALIRCCRERLGIEITVGAPFCTFPGENSQLTAFHALYESGTLSAPQLRWASADDLAHLPFRSGDSVAARQFLNILRLRPGRYRHYKGNEYEFLALARHSETLEPMAVYRALYGQGEIWVRPAGMFSETVTKNGKEIPRFVRVGESEKNESM